MSTKRDMKKKSIALLFSGQLRALDIELFRKSLALFIGNHFKFDIYISTWDIMGISMAHNEENSITFHDSNIEIYLNEMFKGFNVKSRITYNYDEWFHNMSDEYKEIQISDNYTFNTKNSLAQLFLIQQSYEQVSSINEYDYFIRLRFDSIFFFELNEYLDKSVIYNLNFGKAYYPNRVYDIFFVAPRKYSNIIFKTYSKIPELINNDFENGLEKRDACRLLYLSVASLKYPPKVETLSYRYCDIFREKRGLLGYVYDLYSWNISVSNTFQDKMKFLISTFRLNYRMPLQFLFFLITNPIKEFVFKQYQFLNFLLKSRIKTFITK